MRTRSKIMLTALTAALVLSAVVGTASARRLELSNQRYLVIWRELRLIARDVFGGSHTVNCPVTLEGSFHSRTLSKVSGQLVGYVTRAFVRGGAGAGECTGGTATILPASLPWHMRYNRFIGALPLITGIRLDLIGAAFQVNLSIATCLYTSTAARPALGTIERNTTSGNALTLTADNTAQVPLTSGDFGCPNEGVFEGTGEVFLQGSLSTRIVVRLVQ